MAYDYNKDLLNFGRDELVNYNRDQSDIDIDGRMLVRIPSDLQKYSEITNKNQVALVGMGNKFEIWNIQNWEMRQTGGSMSTEILDVVLPESIKEMSF